MDCQGVDSFGCAMGDLGGYFGGFLDSFGTPASSFIFIILISAFLILIALAIKGAIDY